MSALRGRRRGRKMKSGEKRHLYLRRACANKALKQANHWINMFGAVEKEKASSAGSAGRRQNGMKTSARLGSLRQIWLSGVHRIS